MGTIATGVLRGIECLVGELYEAVGAAPGDGEHVGDADGHGQHVRNGGRRVRAAQQAHLLQHLLREGYRVIAGRVVEHDEELRITSYNVCYTKLLRGTLGELMGLRAVPGGFTQHGGIRVVLTVWDRLDKHQKSRRKHKAIEQNRFFLSYNFV